jgi:cysteine desulfurase
MHPVYLDYAATTPMRDEVRAAMLPYLSDDFGNPSSLHRWGRRAAEGLAAARAAAASALGAKPSEVFFTRGGTESDNLAILGRCRALHAASGTTPTLIVSAIEHHAVQDAAVSAERGGEVRRVVLGVSEAGQVDLDALDAALEAGAAGAAVVSVMWVNNETGIMLPVAEIARRVEAAGGTLHTDAVQAIGKVPVSVVDAPVHLLSATGHKIYGPKGTGLLFARTGTTVAPLLFGGGQERALRPGTEDVAGAVGLAAAMRLVVDEQAVESERLRALRDRLEARVLAGLDGVRINGGSAVRAPHISSLGVEDVDGQALLMALDLEGLAASGGSACASGSTAGSHVISALYGADDPRATVRFSLGRTSDQIDVDRAADVLTRIVSRLRGLDGAA